MNRHGSSANRLYRYGPLIVWMAFIFLASTGTMNAGSTSRIIRPLALWLFPGISESALLALHMGVRKLAHFTEYAILAVLAIRAFWSSSREWLRRHPALAAFLLVAIYALSDEYHQSFVASRTGSIYDSLIDMAGGATAILVYGRNQDRRLRGD